MLAYSTDGIYLVASFGGLSILGLALLPHFFVIPRVGGFPPPCPGPAFAWGSQALDYSKVRLTVVLFLSDTFMYTWYIHVPVRIQGLFFFSINIHQQPPKIVAETDQGPVQCWSLEIILKVVDPKTLFNKNSS